MATVFPRRDFGNLYTPEFIEGLGDAHAAQSVMQSEISEDQN